MHDLETLKKINSEANKKASVPSRDIKRHRAYNHDLKRTDIAVDVNTKEIQERFEAIGEYTLRNHVKDSQVIELFETKFSKRELAFMFLVADIERMKAVRTVMEAKNQEEFTPISKESLRGYI